MGPHKIQGSHIPENDLYGSSILHFLISVLLLLLLCRLIDSTLCLKKNDNDILRYNFNAHQPILIIFGRDIAEWICY